ncbi:MAG: histidinol phosphate phosphatase, HisJ family protein [Anaerocolumna sp.]|jgi:histidinol phosphatase-like PHP family hydrolase|nr:histidinol phosphate phosphatase, HisJ family protein [Anaerocolumna sp.]
MEGLEQMIFGQHFYEVEPGLYSFSMEEKYDEYLGLGNAILLGIKTSYFSAVAHPDRIFRRKPNWDVSMTELSKEIISAVKEKGILMEINASSIRRKQYKQEFWDLVPRDVRTIEGIDAHSVAELNEEFEINL